jgi:hypothetical protein
MKEMKEMNEMKEMGMMKCRNVLSKAVRLKN